MPLYEYHCADCGTTFERLRPMSAADDTETCPACGKSRAGRILSSFATGGGATTSPAAPAGCGPGSFS